MKLRPLIVALLSLLITGCTAVGLAAINLPSHFSDITVKRDIAFGPADWQKLDIYMPPDARRPLDVIIFYYGGRWETGTKEDYRFVGSALARQGFVVVIPDYRKYPQVRFPQFVDDAAASLAWTARHIAAYGGNPGRIHVAGHSAGAHIGALLAVDPEYLRAYGLDRDRVIHDFAGLAGPYDFTPADKDLIAMFGPPSRYSQMQATTFIDGRQPPMLLLWGDRDEYVGKQNMDKVVAAIQARGGTVETKIYPGIGHIGLVTTLSWLGSDKAPVMEDMTAFFCRP